MQCDRNTVFAARPAPWRGTIRKVPAIEARRWPVYQRRAIKTVVRRDWTNNEIDRMVDMLDAGYDLREIAQRLHRTPNAVKIKSTRLGFSMRSRVGIRRGAGRRVVGLTALEARTRIDEATV